MTTANMNRTFNWTRNLDSSDHSEDSLVLTELDFNPLQNGMAGSMENFLTATPAVVDSQQQSTDAELSTYLEESEFTDAEYFPTPVLYRVLCLGSVSQPSKNRVIKKLGNGLSHVFRNHLSDIMATPKFKETKHNLFDLTVVGGKENNSSVEDNGVSLIEGDFTWDSNSFDIYQDPYLEALHYAWNQLPELQRFKLDLIKGEVQDHEFNGHVFLDKTPSGIDLCVYFYGGDDNDPRTDKDFNLVWKLSKMGINVLPIASVSDLSLRHITDRLNQRRIKCLDLTGIQRERPSFVNNYKSTRQRLGDTTSQLRPYEILHVDQFTQIQSSAIYDLLKQSRYSMATRETLNRVYEENRRNRSSNTPLKKVSGILPFYKFIIIVIIGVCAVYFYYTYEQSPPQVTWISTFQMSEDQRITLSLTNQNHNNTSWPSINPCVWINSKEETSIQRIPGSPGKYYVSYPHKYNPMYFTITSATDDDQFIITNNQTFVWVNKPPIPTYNEYARIIVQNPMLFLKAMLYSDT
ncbi:hypothetical protein K501DRAFT_331261 [Backusella circina FSU 941]|nr:hypothetical protein K501DRAFT_331261 [Backusella circina FSU 941]